jgi:hypothetical protein
MRTGLAADKAEVIGLAWPGNLVAMSRVVLGQTLVVNKLVDLDWRFGGAHPRLHLGRGTAAPN